MARKQTSAALKNALSYCDALCSTGAMNSRSDRSAVTSARSLLKSHKMAPHRETLVTLRTFLAVCLVTVLAAPAIAAPTLLRPAQVFDGVNPTPHPDRTKQDESSKNDTKRPNNTAPANTKVIALPGETLTPGLIEGHSHIFL